MNRIKQIQYRRALTIAGSDSSGGAGIQADLKTFAASGCYGMSVITAVTAQNTIAVSEVHPIPAKMIAQQIDAVLTDIGIDAVKIGMLFCRDIINTVAQRLRRYETDNIVLDPVLVAQSGDSLMQQDAVDSLKSDLMPACLLITPNLPEAEVLLGHPVQTLAEMKSAAREIAALGPANVLIKGGHSTEHLATDVLYLADIEEYLILKNSIIPTHNNHGTGCTLSAAICAQLAHGNDIKTAVKKAKIYISNAMQAGAAYRLGQGHGPVHHFFEFWK